MERYRVKPGSRVKLRQWDPKDQKECPEGKEKAGKKLVRHTQRLVELQERLYAEHRHRLLVVIQGMDTAGKDGTIRHVFEGVNPQGVRVFSFKQPTPQELDHDFLWRVHVHTPALGEIVIFNRSHYEDVLAVRVHELVPEKVWSQRFRHINDFERLLAGEGTTIVKLFLHISKDEQKERLLERLHTPDKQWKLSASDASERKLWPKYMKAYEEVLSRTSTDWAPWYVIPSDHKWYRNYAAGEIIVRTLEKLDIKKPKPRIDLKGYKID
ncbi:MAG: polyphosphate kinase 2 family protein [Lentisphaerota bacterium]